MERRLRDLDYKLLETDDKISAIKGKEIHKQLKSLTLSIETRAADIDFQKVQPQIESLKGKFDGVNRDIKTMQMDNEAPAESPQRR